MQYLSEYSELNNRPSTFYRNTKICNNLVRFFSGRDVIEIEEQDIEAYKKDRKQTGVEYSTINRELAVLRAMLNWRNRQVKGKMPIPKITMFKVDNARVRFLEDDEYRRLIEQCTEPLKSMVILAVNTGMRRGEILSLKWHYVYVKRGVITLVETKNGEKRDVPINDTAVNVLMAIAKHPDSDYVFSGRIPSEHIDESYVSHKFEKAVHKAKIKDFRFHDLRHTFASWLVMRGVDLKTVQELLGHKTFTMTLRYAHLSPEHKKQAVDILDEKSKIIAQDARSGHYLDTKPITQDLRIAVTH